MKKIFILLVGLMILLNTACENSGNKKMKKKKAILVVSFGTSYKETRKITIEAVEKLIEQKFPDFEVRRAFTSKIIRKIMNKRDGIKVDSVDEALQKFHNEGFREVYIQPLHIIPGFEYNDVLKIVDESTDKFEKIVLGEPLLFNDRDIVKVAESLKLQYPDRTENHAVVFMGHGTHHSADVYYEKLENLISLSGIKNVYIATVDGKKTIDVLSEILKKTNIKEITLMPLMLVAGDHAKNDMAGEDPDSWKSKLSGKYKVNCYLHGLGENTAIREIYMEKIKNIIYPNGVE